MSNMQFETELHVHELHFLMIDDSINNFGRGGKICVFFLGSLKEQLKAFLWILFITLD